MRKTLISLFIMVQVGSTQWVNPEHVVAVTEGKLGCKSYVVVTNTSNFVCSDWDINKIINNLKNWRHFK